MYITRSLFKNFWYTAVEFSHISWEWLHYTGATARKMKWISNFDSINSLHLWLLWGPLLMWLPFPMPPVTVLSPAKQQEVRNTSNLVTLKTWTYTQNSSPKPPTILNNTEVTLQAGTWVALCSKLILSCRIILWNMSQPHPSQSQCAHHTLSLFQFIWRISLLVNLDPLRV